MNFNQISPSWTGPSTPPPPPSRPAAIHPWSSITTAQALKQATVIHWTTASAPLPQFDAPPPPHIAPLYGGSAVNPHPQRRRVIHKTDRLENKAPAHDSRYISCTRHAIPLIPARESTARHPWSRPSARARTLTINRSTVLNPIF